LAVHSPSIFFKGKSPISQWISPDAGLSSRRGSLKNQILVQTGLLTFRTRAEAFFGTETPFHPDETSCGAAFFVKAQAKEIPVPGFTGAAGFIRR